MDLFKTLLTFFFGGGLLGGAVASWLAPKWLTWDNTTPLGTQNICDLPVVVEQLTSQLVHAQLIGTGIGAVVMLIVGIIVRRAASPKSPSSLTPAPHQP